MNAKLLFPLLDIDIQVQLKQLNKCVDDSNHLLETLNLFKSIVEPIIKYYLITYTL